LQHFVQNCQQGGGEPLKDCIPLLVSPFQTGFIHGRSIHENIIVAQEVVHSMHKVRGKKGYFAIKVDLAKAYDMLRWDFIHNILKEVGLPMGMVDIIMQGVTSVKTNVNWHGARSAYFQPHRGIRQGDPMSPYIFVICMDKLSHLISNAVNQGKWKGIRAGRTGPSVSHVF
jgi:ribulose 1,5-bisphosphate carboxylase large subunit-like protein